MLDVKETAEVRRAYSWHLAKALGRPCLACLAVLGVALSVTSGLRWHGDISARTAMLAETLAFMFMPFLLWFPAAVALAFLVPQRFVLDEQGVSARGWRYWTRMPWTAFASWQATYLTESTPYAIIFLGWRRAGGLFRGVTLMQLTLEQKEAVVAWLEPRVRRAA
jgi:hypothetical protein